MSNKLAEAYEKRYPGTGCSEAQKQEREERLRFKEERQALRRTGRNRGVTFPSWFGGFDENGNVIREESK